MKIKKISADSFGRLKNKQIDFEPGINVVVGANESGKSSVARFIRFMLYGFTSRAQEISKNDKKKYMPWDDNACKGSAVLDSEGEMYTVRREQTARASHSITDSSGTPVHNGLNAGEVFLGVDADTFDKTAFISAGDVFFDDAVTLSAAIKNMVFSADSEVDSEAAVKKLDTFARSILGKTQKSGRLYDARKELSELIARKTELAEIHKQLLGAQAHLDKIRENINKNNGFIEKLKREKENLEALSACKKCENIDKARDKAAKSLERYQNKNIEMTVDGTVPDRLLLTKINDALIELTESELQTDKARNELSVAKEALKASYGNTKQLKFNETLIKAEKTQSDLEGDVLILKKKQKSSKIIAIILTVLIVTLPVSLFFWLRYLKIKKHLEKLVLQFNCSDLAELEYLLSNFDLSMKATREANDRLAKAENELEQKIGQREIKAAELCSLLDKSGGHISVTDTSELSEFAKNHIKKLSAEISVLEELESEMNIDAAALESLLGSLNEEELREKAATYTTEIPLREESKNALELDFYTRANEGLAVQEREYEKRAAVISSNMEKPDELISKINMLSEEIEEFEKNHAAAEMAKEAIEKSHERIRGNVSPILTEKASKLFSEMTGGKYVGLYVDKDLALTFLEKDSAEYRSVEYLSSGAMDAAYLSLRITLTQLLYNQNPPLIFDDAFSRLDDERLERVCTMLKKLSEQYQVIILSCHDREAKMLGANTIKFE